MGAQQLKEIRNQMPEEYKEHILVLVSWAEASPELKQKAQDWDIVLICGEDLVDWIYDCLENLDLSNRTKLGIGTVPSLLV
jgi:hypothetical protein